MIAAPGRRVVVTGAAGGLGSALCDLLAARGYDVTGTDIAWGPAVTTLLDVTDADACHSLATRLQPQFWINNAAVLAAGNAVSQSDHEIMQCLDVNLRGVVNGSRAAAEVMLARGNGRILNIGSLASWISLPGEAVYAATKHGVRAFSAGLASELRGSGVTVGLLCPDGIWTPMLHDRLEDPHARLSFTGRRLLTAEEVARAGVDLLESKAFLRCVPRLKGAQVRALGSLPRLWFALSPVLRGLGAVNQRRLRRTIEGAQR